QVQHASRCWRGHAARCSDRQAPRCRARPPATPKNHFPHLRNTIMKFRLSPLFLMAVMAVAAIIPMTFGLTVEAVTGSILCIAASAALVQPGATRYRAWNPQMGKIGEEGIEEQYKQVQANLKEVGDQLKAHAEQAQKDVERHKEMSAETRAKVDE